jgi:hypothetical protein
VLAEREDPGGMARPRSVFGAFGPGVHAQRAALRLVGGRDRDLELDRTLVGQDQRRRERELLDETAA